MAIRATRCVANDNHPVPEHSKAQDSLLAKRQLDFEDAKVVFEATNFETEDTRKDYGEKRILCFGMLKNQIGRAHV